jgi:hypothetical protein
MLISDSKRFIFVHIRKAAGTSMVDALLPFALPKPNSIGARLKSRSHLERNYRKYRFRKHDDILAAKKRMPTELFEDYFKFAFVRNPWDRLVSEYEFIRKRDDHGRHKRVTGLESFSDYIRMQIPRRDAYQFHMLTDKSGQLVVDYVGRFESLDVDWEIVSELAGIPVKPLPHKNKTKHRDFREYYDDDCISLVAEHWAGEIKLFNYSFDNS